MQPELKVKNLENANNKNRYEISKASVDGTVHVLVYRIDEQGYGLFLSDLERATRAVAITPIVDAPENIMGIINLQGRVVPVLNMRKKLGLSEREVEPSDHFIIARTGWRTVALAVDSVEGVVELLKADVVQSEEIAPGLESVRGVVKIHDDLILIYDLDRFLFCEELEELDAALGDD
ncbi:MAG: chemotaxis protein CheW [bacterium]